MCNWIIILIFVYNLETMKGFITLLLVFLTSISFSQTDVEVTMINKINEIRVSPTSFIPEIKSYICSNERMLKLVESGKMKAVSINGMTNSEVIQSNIDAAKELIIELNDTKSLGKLTFNSEMYKITKDHGTFLDSINTMQHKGKNGGFANDRMEKLNFTIVTENLVIDNGNVTSALIVLLVDARIDGRGHRKNLLDPKVEFVSVYTNGTVWVQNFSK